MKTKHFLTIVFLLTYCLVCCTGCKNDGPAVPESTAAAETLPYMHTDGTSASLPPEVRVVGLGEASHGVKEYHQMKAEVFKALAENNGCRTFIIEGDFGGALKVDDYIHGGAGTAQEAVGEIGFAIYRTEELAELVDWMRAYNETVPEEKSLHFYGMDLQRFDHNKEYLFSVLDAAAPELGEKYRDAFSRLTDDNDLSSDPETLKQGKEDALKLIEEMDAAGASIAAHSGQTAFDFARECAYTIYTHCDLLLSDQYNDVRDRYMAEKVDWFLQHGDGSILFINGHNGHIGKTSVAGYTCLGEQLAASLGDGYYAIGTDARETVFNSQKEEGGFEVVEVSNENELNGQLDSTDPPMFFIDFAEAAADESWAQILSSKQKLITLNVGLPEAQRKVKAFYTTTIVPEETFDAMIVFRRVAPTTILKNGM